MVDDAVLPNEKFCEIGSEIIADRIRNITLCFAETDSSVNLVNIEELELLPNNNIVIKGRLFSPSLYNAYVNQYIIEKLIEIGICKNSIDFDKQGNYMVEYYNYRFKEFSFSRTENTYLFILEPIEKGIQISRCELCQKRRK